MTSELFKLRVAFLRALHGKSGCAGQSENDDPNTVLHPKRG